MDGDSNTSEVKNMPVLIPNSLPAKKILEQEIVFLISEERAKRQDVRPMRIAILNLMPQKNVTETQLLRLLGNTPLQVEVTLVHMATHISKNTTPQHLLDHYVTIDVIQHKQFDGFIITGAPVEQFNFEQVDYWQELTAIFKWSEQHVSASFYICWGAQAALYYQYGIPKYRLNRKLSGIFMHRTLTKSNPLIYGFDDRFYAPHSRYTETHHSDIEKINDLTILADSEEAGIYLLATQDGRQVFVTGHPEYDQMTLKAEYQRDCAMDPNLLIPTHYFPNNDILLEPVVTWRSHANLLFENWLNHCVYQMIAPSLVSR